MHPPFPAEFWPLKHSHDHLPKTGARREDYICKDVAYNPSETPHDRHLHYTLEQMSWSVELQRHANPLTLTAVRHIRQCREATFISSVDGPGDVPVSGKIW